MPKIKPNEQCPCESGKKYKKCCFVSDYNARADQAKDFETCLDANEKNAITSERLNRLNTYFLDRYNIQSINITGLVNNLTLNKIHNHYRGRKLILLCERNTINDSAFKSKGAKTRDQQNYEDIMVIYKNFYLQFNYDSEYEQAMVEINKWLKS